MHKVILADDHDLIRESLLHRLEATGDVKVVAQANSGTGLLKILENTPADLVVLDLAMPELNGLQVLSRARGDFPDMLWVILSSYPDYARDARRLGASGYLLKSEPGERVALAVLSLLGGGEPVFSSGLIPDTGPEHEFQGGANSTAAPGLLSRRETQILRLIARGLKHSEIAAELSVVERTVEFHKRNIKNKLKLTTTAELIQYAVRHNLV